MTIDGKDYTRYEATQEQRRQEQNIRATKREIEARKAIGSDYKDLNAKLRVQRTKYNEFSAAAGIRTKPNRLVIK